MNSTEPKPTQDYCGKCECVTTHINGVCQECPMKQNNWANKIYRFMCAVSIIIAIVAIISAMFSCSVQRYSPSKTAWVCDTIVESFTVAHYFINISGTKGKVIYDQVQKCEIGDTVGIKGKVVYLSR